MIIDFHTHIFPPRVREERDEHVRRDPTFAEMYRDPKAKLATAADLLKSMDEAGVDVSVALGFAWSDPEDCRRHNDYLLEAGAASGGRIVPFCTVNPGAGEPALAEVERCAAAGARGLGELRPQSQGWDTDGERGDALTDLARRHGLILLFHVTEPVGHDYPGKQGLPLKSFYRFCERAGDVPTVGAHLAGGLPLYAPLRSAKEALASAYADTAALRYLYEPSALPAASANLAPGRLLFGSDFPLISQAAALEDARCAGLDAAALRSVLGEGARQLLRR